MTGTLNAEQISAKVVELVGGTEFLQRRGQELLDALALVATPTQEGDRELLRGALKLFEYVTWHDGRYRQELNAEFQRDAQKLVTRLAARLGVEPYADYRD
jgi:hypothetical protein